MVEVSVRQNICLSKLKRLSFHKKIFLFLFMCMYECLYVNVLYVWPCLKRPEEDTGYPGAGGDRQWGAWCGSWSSGRALALLAAGYFLDDLLVRITDPTVKHDFGLGALFGETPLQHNLEGKLAKDVMQMGRWGLILSGSHGNECRAWRWEEAVTCWVLLRGKVRRTLAFPIGRFLTIW